MSIDPQCPHYGSKFGWVLRLYSDGMIETPILGPRGPFTYYVFSFSASLIPPYSVINRYHSPTPPLWHILPPPFLDKFFR